MKNIPLIISLFLLVGCSDHESSELIMDDTQESIIALDSIQANWVPDEIAKDTLNLEDTLFIMREDSNGVYHAIFIEKDEQSDYYSRLLNFEFAERDWEAFDNFKKKGKNINTFGLPQNWMPLVQYREDYFLYAPCDGGNARRRILTDSALVYWYMDGPNPVGYTGSRRVDETTYEFSLEQSDDPYTLTIHIIDPETQMAVWEFSNLREEDKYMLYVPVDKNSYFDMIINYCPDQKEREFRSENIDYKELLNR